MKLLKLTLIIITFIGVFSSCENESEALPEGFTINKVTNEKTINEIKDSFSKKNSFNKSKTANSEFDFENIKEIYNPETEAISYMVNSTDSEHLNLGVYPSSDGNYKIFKVEESIEGDLKKIIYKDLNNVILSEVTFDLSNQTISVNNNSSKGLQKSAGCGQAVADCVNTNYNDNGWWGVAGYAITLFNPWFGVAVIGGCVLYAC